MGNVDLSALKLKHLAPSISSPPEGSFLHRYRDRTEEIGAVQSTPTLARTRSRSTAFLDCRDRLFLCTG